MKLALLILALLGGVWGARSLGREGDAWGGGEQHATFHDDGSPRSAAALEDGRMHGPARTWHRGGAPASQGRYAHGEREGEWRFWNEDGSLDPLRSGIYRAGVRSAALPD